ncbi:hypothetical protein GDO81_028031 [Engystomops pustulosus]|uniref:TIL domain-containing protein n=1 Tax=Engystomops pustulosus TaxID=76066 RepID=A0AAV6ZEB9_ENGPU|nr:hypothetical protein GDO81_028031 [Engystomops pustulosus]
MTVWRILFFLQFGILAQKCLENQEWDECGTACPANCETIGMKDMICTMQCVEGCFCWGRYIFLSGTSGPCVLPEQCPKKKDPKPNKKPIGVKH